MQIPYTLVLFASFHHYASHYQPNRTLNVNMKHMQKQAQASSTTVTSHVTAYICVLFKQDHQLLRTTANLENLGLW